MATTFFPTSTVSTRTSSSFSNNPDERVLSLTRGGGAVTDTQNTNASVTAAPISTSFNNCQVWGVATNASIWTGTALATGSLVFFSNPLNAVTISGAITVNARGLESNAMANYAAASAIYKIAAGNGALTAFALGSNNTEYGTSEAARSITMTVTSTNFAAGDMIAIVYAHCAANGTTGAAGFTASGFYNGASGATGDSFVTFTETITEQAAARTPRNSAINHQNPAVLMEGMAQDKRNHLWLPKRKIWRPHIALPTPATI